MNEKYEYLFQKDFELTGKFLAKNPDHTYCIIDSGLLDHDDDRFGFRVPRIYTLGVSLSYANQMIHELAEAAVLGILYDFHDDEVWMDWDETVYPDDSIRENIFGYAQSKGMEIQDFLSEEYGGELAIVIPKDLIPEYRTTHFVWSVCPMPAFSPDDIRFRTPELLTRQMKKDFHDYEHSSNEDKLPIDMDLPF